MIRVDSVYQCNDELRCNINANLEPFKFLCCNGDNNPYLVISKARENNINQDFVRVYSTDQVVDTTEPVWPPIKERLGKLCNGDRCHPLMFEVYSYVDN